MAYENVTHIDLSIGKSGVVKTTLVDNDFEENSLTISASSTASSGFNIGGACKKQLSITLTRDGLEKLKASSTLRRKACLHVIAEETDGTLSDKVYFYITEPTVDDYYAELICYDGMVAFDKKIPESVLTEMQSEHTIEQLFQLCVSNCTTNFYELSFDSSSIKVNKGVRLKLASDSTIDTYLSCIEYLSAIAGGFAEVDTKGTLKISYYSKVRKEGVSAEPDDIQDFKQDFAMSKVAVVKTSVGGFDYTMGVEASESDYDQLTVEQYENPFLRGFISEGEESKNPNIENIFNNMASTIIDMTFYGSNCAVPARGGINLGDLIGTTREVASVGSGVVDYEAEADILVTDYTWGYQNQINFKCNASVSNINPSSSGLNKGSVYKPVSGSGRDNRLDEIADRLEDESSKLFNSNVEMSLYDWATEGSKNELSVKDARIVYYVNKLTVRRDTVKYVKIKNINVNVGIRSDIMIPDIDDSVVESVEEGVTSKEGYELIGRFISAGNWVMCNRDSEKVEISSASGLYVACVFKKSGEALSTSDLSDSKSLIDNSTPPAKVNYDDFIFLNSGRFLGGRYPENYTTFDFSPQLSLINDTVYASILKNSVDSLSERNTSNTNPDFDSDCDYLDIYVVVYGRPDIQSYENDILNYTPIVSHVNFCYKSPSSQDANRGHYKIDSPYDDWGTWNDIYKNMYMSLDISFEVDFVERSSGLMQARSLIGYLSNKSTTDIIVDEISKNNYTASREYVMYLYRSLYNTINTLTEYVLGISAGSTPSDEIESLKNEINSLSSSITDIEKAITKLENNDSTISSDISSIKTDIANLKDRVTKLEEDSGGVTPDPDPEPTPTSSKTPIARYTNETEVVIDSSHSDVLSMQLEVEKDTNTMLSFSATGGMSSEGLLDFHVFYDNSEIAFNPKFFVSKPYETISFSTSFLPISKDKRVVLSITCTTSDASINFLKDSISVSVINAELPKSDTEFNYAIPDVVIQSSIVSLRDFSNSVTTQ